MNQLTLKTAWIMRNNISPRAALFGMMTLALVSSSRATIPEPDNILYGTITLNGVPVTSGMTNVIIEARRTTNGPAIASYRMGSDQQVGNFYSLRLTIESVPPINNGDASQTGDLLFIVLRDNSGIRGTTNFTVVERGAVQRADFGMAVGDGDGDGLPDLWELFRFGSLTPTPGTLTNGQTVLQHFIAGTDPNDPTGGFRLYIEHTNNLRRVWFVARRAEGPGYDGMTRLYTLEFKPSFGSGFWTTVPGYLDVVGTNQTVNYFTGNLGNGNFRGRVSLLGFKVPGDAGPLLTIQMIGPNSARVSWPSPSTGFVLQEKPGLASPIWVNTAQIPGDDGLFRFIVVNPSGSRVYRLIKTP